MNQNYQKLLNYFQEKAALSREKAIAVDDFKIDNLSPHELKEMLKLWRTYSLASCERLVAEEWSRNWANRGRYNNWWVVRSA
jgi:hypothetical protein